jgi:HEAT repeat protein
MNSRKGDKEENKEITEQATVPRRGRLFWTGVVLLSISALAWVIFIATAINEPDAAAAVFFGGVFVTSVPIGLGVWLVMRSKKARVAKSAKLPKTVSSGIGSSAEKAPDDQKAMWKQAAEVFNKLRTQPWAEDMKLREELLGELRETGQATLQGVFAMLNDSREGTRQEACRILGLLGGIEALWLLENGIPEELLIQRLRDDSEKVQVEAIHSLVLIEEVRKSGKTIPALINVLKNYPNPAIRIETAMMLGFIKWDSRVTEALVQAIADKEAVTRESLLLGTQKGMSVEDASALSLSKIGDKRGVAAMIPVAMGWHEKYIAEAFNAIGPAGIEYLAPYLHDKDDWWRKKAIEALGAMGGAPLVIEELGRAMKNDESLDVRRKALKYLKNIGEPAIHLFIEALKDNEHSIRMNAADTLRDIGDETALEPLTRAAEDKTWLVRDSARQALKKIQNRIAERST